MTAEPRIVSGEQAKALREAATDGPWRADDEHGLLAGTKPAWVVSRTNGAGDFLGDLAYIPQDMGIPSGLPTPQEQADAELIAAAPDLAYTVQVQAERIDALTAALRGVMNALGPEQVCECVQAEGCGLHDEATEALRRATSALGVVES